MTVQKHQNKLAIVIPYYKIDFLEETIQSVNSQSDKNFTLYIGNDASPENPLPIISKYFKENEYHYFNYNDNLGGKNLALQWERILDNVEEDWFQILGDDDVIAENFVEQFYKLIPELEKKEITAVKFIHEWIDENSNHIETFDYRTDVLNSAEFIIQKYNGLVKSSLSENIFQTKMYRKYRFEKLPLAWGSDDIALLSFSNYKKILYDRKSKVKVRVSGVSISGSEAMERKKNIAYNCFRVKVVTKYSKYFPAVFIEKVIKDYLEFCHYKNAPAKYKIAMYYIKHLNIKTFLKTIRKIYYINKVHKLKN